LETYLEGLVFVTVCGIMIFDADDLFVCEEAAIFLWDFLGSTSTCLA